MRLFVITPRKIFITGLLRGVLVGHAFAFLRIPRSLGLVLARYCDAEVLARLALRGAHTCATLRVSRSLELMRFSSLVTLAKPVIPHRPLRALRERPGALEKDARRRAATQTAFPPIPSTKQSQIPSPQS